MAAGNKDVFGVESTIGGAWSLDGAVLELQNGDDLIVTGCSLNYARASQKFSPLNRPLKYVSVGQAEGTLKLDMIIGPNAAVIDFLDTYSSVCKVKENVIRISPAGVQEDCADNNPVWFKCTGVLINALTLGVQQRGGAMTTVDAGLTMSFISLSMGQGVPADGVAAGVAEGEAVIA